MKAKRGSAPLRPGGPWPLLSSCPATRRAGARTHARKTQTPQAFKLHVPSQRNHVDNGNGTAPAPLQSLGRARPARFNGQPR